MKGNGIKMNKSYTLMELEAIKKLCKCVNSVANLPADLIADTNVATNTTYSSYKIDAEMSALENDIQTYVDTALAGLNKLTKEVIEDKALVVKENVLYLYKDPSDMNNDYMQMMLINGVAIELGSTTCDFSSVYSKDEIDNKFALKIDLDVLTTSFNNLVTSVENKIDKDKIATVLDDSVTDEQVASALLTKTELDKTNAKLGELSDSLVDIESTLDELENITRLTDFDEAIPEKGKNKIYYVNKLLDPYTCAQWRVESMYYDVSGIKQYRGVQIATSINGVDNIMLMRGYYLDDNNVVRWGAWQELATMDKVDELFQSVSDGKTLVANAITDKGVSTSTTATFATMATNISKISAYKEETKSKTFSMTGISVLTITFSANILAIKQIIASSESCSIVPQSSKNIFTINGKELIVHVTGGGTWSFTALIES